MKKYLLLLLGVLLIAAGVYFLTKDEEFDALKSPELPQAAVVEEEVQPVFAWRFVEEGEGIYGAPQMRVFLSMNDMEKEIATTTGSCAELTGDRLDSGQVTSALCWWGGAGDEFAVYKEGKAYVVKKGQQDEPAPDYPGFRGNFETLLTF